MRPSIHRDRAGSLAARTRRTGRPALLGSLLAGLLAACGRVPEADGLRVVVSVAPLAWFVEQLAGPDARITVLLPAGATPVTFVPGMDALRAASSARIVVRIGHPAFVWERTWLARAGNRQEGLVTVEAAADCPVRPEDPHVWLSPSCARRMAGAIAAAIQRVEPERAAETAERLSALEREIDAVDAEIRARLGPFRGRAFLVFHPAWGYFAQEYGLRQIALERPGLAERGSAAVARALGEARRLGIRTVFVQPQISPAGAASLGSEIGAEVVILDPLGGDWAVVLRDAGAKLERALAAAAESDDGRG